MIIKNVLKRVRASQPLNQLTTAAVKGLFTATGRQSEFVIKHLPRVGPTAVALPNGRTLKFHSQGDDGIPTQLFWRGWTGYEPELTPLFFRLATQARVVFDVGAFIGLYSLLAGLAQPAAQVVAFEPLARVFTRLERNVALNELDNVRCLHAAAGAEAGVQEFYYPEGSAPVTSSLRSEMLLALLPHEQIRHTQVSVVTLDGVAAQYGLTGVDLIKLDTERTEHDVLAGAQHILARDRADILCEVWPDAGNGPQLEALLRPLGYRFYQLFPTGAVARSEIVGDEQALNYLFTARPGEPII